MTSGIDVKNEFNSIFFLMLIQVEKDQGGPRFHHFLLTFAFASLKGTYF